MGIQSGWMNEQGGWPSSRPGTSHIVHKPPVGLFEHPFNDRSQFRFVAFACVSVDGVGYHRFNLDPCIREYTMHVLLQVREDQLPAVWKFCNVALIVNEFDENFAPQLKLIGCTA